MATSHSTASGSFSLNPISDQVSFRQSGPPDHPILEVTGEIDMVTADDLRQQIYRLIDTCTHEQHLPLITISLAGLEFIDSSGLRALHDGLKRAQDLGGSLDLCDLNQPTQRLLEVTGLDKLFGYSPAADTGSR